LATGVFHRRILQDASFFWLSLVPRQALDLSDTAADFHVVRAVIQHERFKLTHFRLCRCTRMDNLMLSDILWRIHTLEAEMHKLRSA
jgi:hypothetical protein